MYVLFYGSLLVSSRQFSGFWLNGSDGYVEMDVEYTSIFPGYIEIKDEVCRPARNIECEKAGSG